jgi:hypothetical protein
MTCTRAVQFTLDQVSLQPRSLLKHQKANQWLRSRSTVGNSSRKAAVSYRSRLRNENLRLKLVHCLVEDTQKPRDKSALCLSRRRSLTLLHHFVRSPYPTLALRRQDRAVCLRLRHLLLRSLHRRRILSSKLCTILLDRQVESLV